MEEYTTTIIQTFMKGNIVSLVPHWKSKIKYSEGSISFSDISHKTNVPYKRTSDIINGNIMTLSFIKGI